MMLPWFVCSIYFFLFFLTFFLPLCHCFGVSNRLPLSVYLCTSVLDVSSTYTCRLFENIGANKMMQNTDTIWLRPNSCSVDYVCNKNEDKIKMCALPLLG